MSYIIDGCFHPGCYGYGYAYGYGRGFNTYHDGFRRDCFPKFGNNTWRYPYGGTYRWGGSGLPGFY